MPAFLKYLLQCIFCWTWCMCIIWLNSTVIYQKKLQELFSRFHNRTSIPLHHRLAPELMNHSSPPSLPRQPAWSRNTLAWEITFSGCYKQQKKKGNIQTTKQLLARGLATDTTTPELRCWQWFMCPFEGNKTEENPGFSVTDISFLFAPRINSRNSG